jgi:hypothetical protein
MSVAGPIGSTIPEGSIHLSGVESWLLHSDVQIGSGDQQGGVAGWLDADGEPEFVYLEIVGYYLTTMAWLTSGAATSPEHAALANRRAREALRWVAKVLSRYVAPPTRLYLSEARADWRNDALFSFDLAMAARGVASTGSASNRRTRRRAFNGLCARMDRISCGADIMRSHETVNGSSAAIPNRWSTRPGPHHLKAAGAVLHAGGASDALTALAHRTCEHWTSVMHADDWPCQELHALLYGLEGMLLADARRRRRLNEIAWLFARLMQLQSSDGTLPETVGGGIVRSDVLAQALRVGLLLRGRGCLAGPGWGDRLDALADALVGFIRPDGGVLFAKDQTIANTWCAMFAHQALYLHARQDAEDPAPDTAFAYLV